MEREELGRAVQELHGDVDKAKSEAEDLRSRNATLLIEAENAHSASLKSQTSLHEAQRREREVQESAQARTFSCTPFFLSWLQVAVAEHHLLE